MADEGNDQASSNWSLHETIFKIVQDAQAAGSVIQIITIWPPTSPEGKASQEMHAGCMPVREPECTPLRPDETTPPKPPKK